MLARSPTEIPGTYENNWPEMKQKLDFISTNTNIEMPQWHVYVTWLPVVKTKQLSMWLLCRISIGNLHTSPHNKNVLLGSIVLKELFHVLYIRLHIHNVYYVNRNSEEHIMVRLLTLYCTVWLSGFKPGTHLLKCILKCIFAIMYVLHIYELSTKSGHFCILIRTTHGTVESGQN